jgi:hypothetical protein
MIKVGVKKVKATNILIWMEYYNMNRDNPSYATEKNYNPKYITVSATGRPHMS